MQNEPQGGAGGGGGRSGRTDGGEETGRKWKMRGGRLAELRTVAGNSCSLLADGRSSLAAMTPAQPQRLPAAGRGKERACDELFNFVFFFQVGGLRRKQAKGSAPFHAGVTAERARGHRLASPHHCSFGPDFFCGHLGLP